MPTPFEDFDLLPLPEVAKLLHCSKAHVGKIIEGRVKGCEAIPCVSLGRRRLVRRETLHQWLVANERIAANDNVRVANDAKLTTSPEWDVRKRA